MISKDDNILMILQKHKGISSVFEQMGMDCENCSSAAQETIVEGCEIHREDIGVMLILLNDYISNKEKY